MPLHTVVEDIIIIERERERERERGINGGRTGERKKEKGISEK